MKEALTGLNPYTDKCNSKQARKGELIPSQFKYLNFWHGKGVTSQKSGTTF